jgi:hypothetical protein
MSQLPLWLQYVSVFAPAASALIGGIFLIANATRQRRADRIKNLVDIADKIDNKLDAGHAVDRAIIDEIYSLDLSLHPWFVGLRRFTYISLLVIAFFAGAAVFPHVLNFPTRVQNLMPRLAIGYSIVWLLTYISVSFGAMVASERQSHIFKAAALFELDIRRDDEVTRIKKMHSEVTGIRKLSKRYEDLEAWLWAHDVSDLLRVLLRLRRKAKKATLNEQGEKPADADEPFDGPRQT